MKIMLEATDVRKSYGLGKEKQEPVLKGINLQLEKGEFVSVMGPSGSGKSTLLHTISGMDCPTSGSVKYKGQDISHLNEEERAKMRLLHMGFIFQHIHLLKNLNLFDNIILPAYTAKRKGRKQINDYATKLMKQTGILNISTHDLNQASGGQLQRVGICRALINDPDILFGDEPTGALNHQAATEIMDLLTDIHLAGTTILLVTHDIKVAARTERVLYIVDGEIVGEKQLGIYTQANQKTREEDLSNWLLQLGF